MISLPQQMLESACPRTRVRPLPPLGGVLIGDWIARWRAGQPALETLTEKVRWPALVPYVLGCVVAWVSNESGIGIAPLGSKDSRLQ